MTSGTIIHTKSRMTDGATSARPAVVVCCVAILLALPAPDAGRRLGRRTFDSPCRWLASERGADRRDPPFHVDFSTPPSFSLLANEEGAGTGRNVPLGAQQ